MLVLFETPAGYAIFKLLDQDKLTQSENLYKDFQNPEIASRLVQLKYFHKFEDTTEALAATTAIVEGKLSKSLRKTLKNCCTEAHEQLAVADARLGLAIKEKLSVSCINNTAIQELMRCIRSQMDSLVTGVTKKEMTAMALGLAHSLSRYKLKFSPDKVDTMVIQAVCLLDDLDKELNNYMMRAREWYGWHFPELGKIVTDNLQYIKTMQIVGQRENAVKCDLSDILTVEVEERVKEAAETSMGSEISEYDAEHMQCLCVEIIELHQYRTQLHDYLKTRMMALAPNLSVLVGDLIGARLISKAGSLTNLAKHPASTLQILGAEKALFRALKSKRNTPKYGLIYHSQLVGQSSNKNKGKISRMLAAKASLATRVDALGDTTGFELGAEHKVRLEAKLRDLEAGNIRRVSGTARAKSRFEKYHSKNESMQYSASVDSTLQASKSAPLIVEIEPKEGEEIRKKKKKKRSTNSEVEVKEESQTEVKEEPQTEVKKEEAEAAAVSKKKKKRDVESKEEQGEFSGAQVEPESVVIPKKKKKHSIESKTEDTTESSSAQEEGQVKIGSNVSKKRKKHSMEPENTKEEELNTSLKKKKKHSKEPKEDVGESSGMQEAQAEADSSDLVSKKKKHSKEPKEDVGESSGMQEAQAEADSSDLVSKKKKKKKKDSIEEAASVKIEETFEMDISIGAETSGEQKKKKKKKEKESEEMQQTTVSVEEVEKPVSSEKKKKKKKSKQD
ncbi:nucleolar protein 58 [Temnothorax nylanderi]|uniref:nucleolar protein 58 n=1 Tax=Temnothorax nylanderi TaxID=102681 RepID=UPI003A84502A